ncbi:MAG: DMT family transporter [Rubrivivax sp.]|nr:DMT family transporter [Rubrivivax sp.]
MTERASQLDRRAIGLVVFCCVAWGLSQVAAKVALDEIAPLLQAGLRSLGAAVLLALWVRWRGLPLWQRDGTGGPGLLAGLLFAAEFGCIFAGLQFTTASRMAVFLYTAPFVVAIGMPFIVRSERLAPLQWLGLAGAFAGVVLALSEGLFDTAAAPAGKQQWIGDLLGVAAAVLWASTTLLLRATRLASAAPEKTLLYQLVVSAVALLAASAVAGEAWPRTLSVTGGASMAFQIVVVTFASYLTWFWLIRHYPATRISAFTLLTPVAGLLAGVWLLGEPLTLRLMLALATVCIGIALVNRRVVPATPPTRTSETST